MTTVEEAIESFYNKPFYFSYSSLSRLLWSPPNFFQTYILGLKEESTEKHLVEGKVIHALLLNKDNFDDLFIVSPENLPTGTTKKIIDRVFAIHQSEENPKPNPTLHQYEDQILEIMKELNYFQNLVDEKATEKNPLPKTGDIKRLEKVLTDQSKNYFSFLQKRAGKTLVDQETVDFCKVAAEVIHAHSKAADLMNLLGNEMQNREVLNETYISMDLPMYKFGLHGIPDSIVVDHDAKVIHINDLKTTQRSLSEFAETVEKYNYWMQAAIYYLMVTEKFKKFLADGYLIKFHFIVIDCNYMVYCFPVSEDSMELWIRRLLDEVLIKANYHYKNRRYELPYQFEVSGVTL